MSAYVVAPLALSLTTGVASVTNLNDDRPGLVYTSTSTTSTSFIVSVTGTYDTVALVGSNLLPGDTMQVELSTSSSITSPLTYSVSGYAGNKDAGATTKTIVRFASSTRTYIRITLTTASAKVFRAQRLIIGKAVVADGMDYDGQQSIEDPSVSVGGIGYQAFEAYNIASSWKFKVSGISNASWKDDWFPTLRERGNFRGVLFVPDDTTMHQNDIIYGNITAKATATVAGYNYYAVELTISAFSP